MGEGNRKLSKRDPESNLLDYKPKGFLPEGLLNYMALLGWSIAEDRDIFTIPEMVEAFEIGRVNPNPARFDIKKCEAINGSHVRLLSPDDLRDRLVPYFQAAGMIDAEPTADQLHTLEAATPLVHERMTLLTEAVEMLRFLFIAEEDFSIDEADRAKNLDEAGVGVVRAAHEALSGVSDWSTEPIEEALRGALVEGLGLKPRLAFGPVRVAVTGSRISPPLFESLELLGRDATLGRLSAVMAS
jgi:glutamyl-tRNA synthetase